MSRIDIHTVYYASDDWNTSHVFECARCCKEWEVHYGTHKSGTTVVHPLGRTLVSPRRTLISGPPWSVHNLLDPTKKRNTRSNPGS